MVSAADAWKTNLTEKIAKLRELLLLYLVNRQDVTVKEIKKELAGTRVMFSEQQIPGTLRELESALNSFSSNQGHQHSFLQLVHLYETTLQSIVDFDNIEPPSFDSIFQSYKDDNELNKLVDEFLTTLKRILADADDTLSAQVSRELEAILKQLQRNRGKSLYDLLPWVDLGIRGLLFIAETHTGIKGMELIYDAIKLSWQIKHRVLERYGHSKNRLLKEHNLKFIEKAAERFPETMADEKAQELLNPPEKTESDT